MTIEPSPLREPQDGHGGIFDLDVGMIQVGPVAADLGDLVVHEPDEQIEHVGRLVDQYAAPFRVPFAARGIGLEVRLVAPAIGR